MSFSDPSRLRVTPALPLTSMVDILFLLLIFFLTASTFRDQDRQIDVALPATQSDTPGGSRTQIVITLTSEGKTYMGDRVYEPAALRHVLAELGRQYPDESVVIRADQNSLTGSAVQVMDMVYAAGLRQVYLATSDKTTAK